MGEMADYYFEQQLDWLDEDDDPAAPQRLFGREVDYTVWTTKEGRQLPIVLIRDSYMENIVRFLEEKKAEQVALGMPAVLIQTLTQNWIDVFTKEIAARKKSGLWFGTRRRP